MDRPRKSSPDAENPLPPFGIRNLNGPLTRPGMVQISGAQYDATIESQPDATLSYVDDDDGEEVTVGSSLELKQRLDEPAPQNIDTWAALDGEETENTVAGERIHIFDIQNTSGSLAVWRDHEAYSSKKLRKGVTTIPDDEGIGKIKSRTSSLFNLGDVQAISKTPDIDKAGRPSVVPLETRPNNEEDLVDIPELLEKKDPGAPYSRQGNFQYYDLNPRVADSSNNLQNSPADSTQTFPLAGKEKASFLTEEPTQCAEPSRLLKKKEHVSIDFGQVFAEALQGVDNHIGGFADFLDMTATTLRSLVEKPKGTDSTPVDKLLDGFKNILVEVGEFGVEVLRHLDSSFVDSGPQSRSGGSESTNSSEISNKPVITAEPDGHVLEIARVQALRPIKATSTMIAEDISKVSKAFTDNGTSKKRVPSHTLADSILDLDNSDPDFSARYPPLPSLRNQSSDEGSVQPSRRKCATGLNPVETPTRTKYPTLSQFEQKNSFVNTQNNGIASAWRPIIPASLPITVKELIADYSKAPSNEASITEKCPEDTRRTVATKSVNPIIQPSSLRSDILTKGFFRGKKTSNLESENLIESADLEKGYTQGSGNFDNTIHADYGIGLAKYLPGAWPETRVNETSPWLQRKLTADHMQHAGGDLVAESKSGDNNFPELSCRSSSPLADPYSQPQTLRRAHTVNFSNPAARLNRPFDPLLSRSRQLWPATNPCKPQLTIDTKQTASNTQSSIAYEGPMRRKTVHANRYQPTLRSTIAPEGQGLTCSSNNEHPLFSRPNHSVRAVPFPNFQSTMERPRNNVAQSSNLVDASTPCEPNLSNLDPFTGRDTRTGTTESAKVNDCVRILAQMGYGTTNKIERSRLLVYAIAAEGDVEQAIEIIEEDRSAAKTLSQE